MTGQAPMQRAMRILVVDDDPEVIQILEVNLKHASFEVIPARNGEEALFKAITGNPDLILLDLVLPDLDGFDICRRLKKSPQTSHIPLIIISAMIDSEEKTAAINAWADYCIAKPFSPTEVVALARACLEQPTPTPAER